MLLLVGGEGDLERGKTRTERVEDLYMLSIESLGLLDFSSGAIKDIAFLRSPMTGDMFGGFSISCGCGAIFLRCSSFHPCLAMYLLPKKIPRRSRIPKQLLPTTYQIIGFVLLEVRSDGDVEFVWLFEGALEGMLLGASEITGECDSDG